MLPILVANLSKAKSSLTDKAMQYVLIELFRNVLLEKIIIETRFPSKLIATVIACAVFIANVNEALDIL